MLKDWKASPLKVQPVKNAAAFKKRRDRVSAQFPNDLIVLSNGHLKVRANDTYYPFRPCSDFYYLTGSSEPDCALVMQPEGDGHRFILFVEPNPGRTNATFFTDRMKGELWEGRGVRLGIPESQKRYGIDDVRALSGLQGFVKEAIGRTKGSARVLRGHCAELESLFGEKTEADAQLATFLSEMRLLKDAEEVRALSEAIAATQRGFEDVIRRMKTAKSERELEGVFYTRARMEGNDVGYQSIVASGDHACTLHWKRNDGTLRKGDMLLLDAGVEHTSYYTADITRTLPLKGKFTKEQREIYSLVLAAQQAAMKQVKPGNDFMEPNRAAMKVLAEGLEKMGLLPTTAEEALKSENQFYRRYSLHNVSHMLGLDVHDCAKARAENYKYGKLQAGMVLTIEPGLYFQIDDQTVPAKYRGIGVRIEDDVLVTKTGCRNLSGMIPTTAEEVERWIAKLWKKA